MNVTSADITPDAFTFTDVSDQELNVANIESNEITLAGVDAGEDIPISVTGGEYAVSTDDGSNFGAFTSTATTVQLGHVVKVRGTSSSSYSTAVDVVLTIGGLSDTFSITTRAVDNTPDAFSLGADVTSAEPSTLIQRQFVLAGIDSGITGS